MKNIIILLSIAVIFGFMQTTVLHAQLPETVEDFREAAQLRRTFWEEYKRDAPSKRNPENKISPSRVDDFVAGLEKMPKISDGGIADLIQARYRSLFSWCVSEKILWTRDVVGFSNAHECILVADPGIGYYVPQDIFVMVDLFPIKTESQQWLSARIRWRRNPYPTEENFQLKPLSLSFAKLGGFHDLFEKLFVIEHGGVHQKRPRQLLLPRSISVLRRTKIIRVIIPVV